MKQYIALITSILLSSTTLLHAEICEDSFPANIVKVSAKIQGLTDERVKSRQIPFDLKVLEFRKALNKEVEDRQQQDVNEAVKALGETIAPTFHPRFVTHIPEMFKLLGVAEIKPVGNLEEKCRKLMEKLALPQKTSEAVLSSLRMSEASDRGIYKAMVHADSAHGYLKRVSNEIFAFHKSFRNSFPTECKKLLETYFSILEDQNGESQTALIGRVFILHKMLLDALVDVYETQSNATNKSMVSH